MSLDTTLILITELGPVDIDGVRHQPGAEALCRDELVAALVAGSVATVVETPAEAPAPKSKGKASVVVPNGATI